MPSFFRCRIIQWIFSLGVIPAVGSSFSTCAAAPPPPTAEKYSMKRWRASGLLLNTKSSASSRSPAEISAYGRIWAGFAIAASSPACTQWWRNTELRTLRASGVSPKLTFETPSIVETPGSSRLIRRMPSTVSLPESIHSASPVASVKVSASYMRSSGARPYSPTTMS